MNPYVYSRREKSRETNVLSASAFGSLVKSIFTTPINTAVAFAMVLFAAGSVAGISGIAYAEMGNSDVAPSAYAQISKSSGGRVLGEMTAQLQIDEIEMVGTARVGQLVLINRTVFFVGSKGLYGVTSVKAFNSWGWTFNQVLSANSAEQALPHIGQISEKLAGCTNPLDQVEGTCGTTTPRPGTSTAPRAGILVFIGRTVYLVNYTGLYGVPSEAVFHSWGWDFNQVVNANSAEQALPQLGSVPYKNPNCTQPFSQIANLCGGDAATPPTIVLAFYQGSNQIYSAKCGESITFNVTNYTTTQIWLTQYKDGMPLPYFDRMITVPDTYRTMCNKDEGSYVNEVYSLVNGQKGTKLGSLTFKVTASNTAFKTMSVTNNTPAAPVVLVPGGVKQKIASFQISPSSISSASLTSVVISATRNTIGNNFQNFKLMVGSTQVGATQPVLLSNNNNTLMFSSPLVVPAGGTVLLDAYVDVSSSATSDNSGINNQNLISLIAVNGTWVADGSSFDPITPVTGHIVTLGAASSAETIRPGKLVKLPTNADAIFVVASNGLYAFTDAATFYSWGYVFSQVIPANSAEAALRQIGTVPSKRAGCNSPLDQIAGTCGTVVTPTYTFSANEKTLVAGRDSWTFYLTNAKPGDKLEVGDVYQDWNIIEGGRKLFICQVPAANSSPIQSSSCSTQPTVPQAKDKGYWYESVYINGEYKGIISFTVTVPPTTATSSPVTLTVLASPSTITAGQYSTISWTSTNATDCGITYSPSNSGDMGRVYPQTSSYQFSPTQTTTYKVNCYNTTSGQSQIKEVTVTVTPTSTTPPPCCGTSTSTPSNATYTFSANNATLVAGRDAWTFTLSNGRAGDKIEVGDVYQDWNIIEGGRKLAICTIQTGATSCTLSSQVQAKDKGYWYESVYINGSYKATIGFTVTVPTTTTPPPPTPPTPSNATYTFSANNATLVAGRDAWSFTLSNGTAGDKLEVGDVYKDWNLVEGGRKLSICTIQTAATSCSLTSIPQSTEKGYWYESVYINGVYKATIGFTVTVPTTVTPTPPTPPTPSNATYTFSANNATLVAGKDSWTFYLTNANPGDKLEVGDVYQEWNPIEFGKKLFICQVPTGPIAASSCTFSGTPQTKDKGYWYESVYINGVYKGVVGFTVTVPTTTTPPPPITPTPPTPSNATYTFSANNATLVAGRDAWTFTLSNGRAGDKLEVGDVYKDWVTVENGNKLAICTIQSGQTSCTLTSIPQISSKGYWVESIYINGSYKGAVGFTVVEPTVSAPNPAVDLKANSTSGSVTIASGQSATLTYTISNTPWSVCSKSGGWTGTVTATGSFSNPTGALTSSQTYTLTCYLAGFPYTSSVTVNVQAPTPSNASYTFSANNATLVAGRDAWTFTLSNANPGDKLEVGDVYQDWNIIEGGRKLFICQVPAANSSPIQSGSCSFTSIPQAASKGYWYESVYINGVYKGVVGFTVTVPTTTTPPPPAPSNPTFSFSANNATLLAGRDSWTFTLSNARAGDKLEVGDVYKDWNVVENGNKLHICTVQSGQTSCSSTGTPQITERGYWVESVYINGSYKGAVGFTVN